MYPRTSVGAAILVLLCTCAAVADPTPESLRPQPILTLDELLERLEAERHVEQGDAVSQAVRLGPDYAWLLAELLQRDDSPALADQICRGLARNGDAESLSLLRAVAGDTTRPWFIRERAVWALAYARDHESIPLLNEVSANCNDRILAEAARDAIRRIESPGSYRPLIEVENGLLHFGFLLDDLESIEYAGSPGVTYSFASGDFRRICDLLQGGSVAVPDGVSMVDALTFRLRDGTETVLRTDGVTYGNISGRLMRAPALREFIWSRLGWDEEHGEPPD